MINFFKNIHNQIKTFLVALFFITLPLENNINSISITALLVYSLFYAKNLKIKKLYEFKFMFLFFLLSCFSLLYTADTESGIKYIVKFLPFIIFPLIFSILDFKRNDLIKIFNLFTVWICCLIVYSELATVIEIIANDNSVNLIFRKDFSYISLANKIGIHPPYFALYISFCIIFLITNFNVNKLPNLVNIIMLILMLFFLVHLSSRLPLIAGFGVSIWVFIKEIRKSFSITKSILIGLIPVLLIFIFIFTVRATKNRFQELIGMEYSSGLYIESGPSKLQQWKSGFLANHNIIFGDGAGDANKSIIESNYQNKLYKNAKREYNAHNQFIQTYVGLGILGLTIIILIIYKHGYILPEKSFKSLFLYFSIYLLIVFMSESYLERHHGIVFICFILCIPNIEEKNYLSISNNKTSSK
jgi:O-antigen ligase